MNGNHPGSVRLDYCSFGMMQPGRIYQLAKDSMYSFGFNDKLKTNEIYGVNNAYDYGERMFDPRLARFLSMDPIFNSYPQLTPYQFASNTPIWAIDLDGMEAFYHTEPKTVDQPFHEPSTAMKAEDPTKYYIVKADVAVLNFFCGPFYRMVKTDNNSKASTADKVDATIEAVTFYGAFGDGEEGEPTEGYSSDTPLPARVPKKEGTTENTDANSVAKTKDNNTDAANNNNGEHKGLTPEQHANLKRFNKKLPANATPTKVHDLPGGGKAFQAESAGKVPGSKAIYEKQVDAKGKTTQYTKTTLNPKGKAVHVKDKMNNTTITPSTNTH
jgi:RHS repeat-associated protein